MTKKIKLFIKNDRVILILSLVFLCILLTPFNIFSQTYENNSNDSLSKDTIIINNNDKKDTLQVLDEKIDYIAKDSIVIHIENNKIKLYNESKINYTTMNISANYIELDSKNSLIYAKGTKDSLGKEIGTPIFVDENKKYSSNALKYNYKTEKGYIEKVFTEEQGGYIHGEKTKRIDENTFYLKHGKYTTCDNKTHPHYYVRLNKAKMVKDKAVFARGFGLTIEETTLLYLPFPIYFPFKKRYSSGFIMPSYGEEENRGFFFKNVGLYFAASEYFDLKFLGDIFTNGSWGGSFHSNYRKRYKFIGNLDARFYRNKFGDKDLDNYTESRDFSIRWTHRQDPKAHPYRNFSASVDFSSSSYDYNNTRSISNIVNNKKHSSISFRKWWPNNPFRINATLTHSQNSRDSTINLSLPYINISMSSIYPFRSKNKMGKLKWYDKFSLSYSAQIRNSIHTHEDELFNSKLSKDWRNGYQHSIPLSVNFKIARDLTFSTSASYNGVLYINSIRKAWDNTNNMVKLDTLPGFNYGHSLTASSSLSFTPKIYGVFLFGDQSKIRALRHVISPSVNIGYSPKIDIGNDRYFKTYSNTTTNQEIEYSIFEGSLFGTPRSGNESANINFSIDNNLEMKIAKSDTSEIEKIKILESFRLSGSYNLLLDSMNLSTLRISGRTSILNQKISLSFGGNLDPYALDDAGRRYNKFHGFLGRLTSLNFSIGANFSHTDAKNSKTQNVERLSDYKDYVDFDIPWNLSINYNYRYSKPGFTSTTTQFLRLTGGLNLTPKWKLTFNTGYDFKQKNITTTQFSLHRDLHCWEMSFSAIPFGYHRSYSFQINVKSSLLKDLKLDKRESWYDN